MGGPYSVIHTLNIMQHYLKTYKKLEKIGIAEKINIASARIVKAAKDWQYVNAILISALPQNKISRVTDEKGFKSMRFSKSLHVRLGVIEPWAENSIMGSCVQLIAADVVPSYIKKKLQLGLRAVKLYRSIRKHAQNHIDAQHFLGILLVTPDARPLFINSDEFQCARFATAPASTLRVCRHAYGRLKTPIGKTFALLKAASTKHSNAPLPALLSLPLARAYGCTGAKVAA